MISVTGWRISFLILGGAGILFGVLWYFFFRDKPEDHPLMPDNEKEYILTGRQEKSAAENAKLSASLLFGSRNVWLAMLQYLGSNFTFFFCLTWLLPHLRVKYGVDLIEAGFYASAPLIFGAAGNWFSGILVDLIYRRKKWSLSRKIPAITGFLMVAAGMILSIGMESLEGEVIMLSLAVFGADMTLSPSWSFCIDIGKENSGTVSGTMNMA